MDKNALGCFYALFALIIFALATYLCVIWFSWKLVLVIYLFLWANNSERGFAKILEDLMNSKKNEL